MTDTATATPPNMTTTGRQIRVWGSTARLAVGVVMLIAAALTDANQTDVLLGLVAFPLIEVLLLALRGFKARPLRLYVNAGHCFNWGVGIAVFSIATQAALVFYGASILLAFARGYAGCEIFAISNWLRRRDDQIVCPLFSPIDHAELASSLPVRASSPGRGFSLKNPTLESKHVDRTTRRRPRHPDQNRQVLRAQRTPART